ncbi:BF3164 family lipoprotein [Penaeicola halotolerans]|uniref:BF3164 family lipoprotein n=1 Tax=Penaeicola halotolerans TaxID=2793196 RepID=UPI001CF8D8A7|nr:BF3164 family lipoprotein [Penaeicola halotolerans]
MRHHLLIIGLLALFVFSCNQPEVALEKQIETIKVSLKGNQFLTDELFSTNFDRVDSLLFVSLDDQKAAFHIYNINDDFSFVKAFAYKGEGPGEFRTAAISDIEQVNDDYHVSIFDRAKYRLTVYSLKDILNEEKSLPIYSFRMHPKHGLSAALVKTGNTTYVGTPGLDVMNRGRLHFYDTLTQESTKNELIPKDQRFDQLSDYPKYNLYFSRIAKHPTKELIASVMRGFDRLDIYDFEGNLVHEVKSPNYEREYELSLIGDKATEKKFYMGVRGSEKYIYAIYYDQLDKDYSRDLIPTQIKIFSWEGQELANIEVPEYLMSFEVDEERGRLYGVAYFEEKTMTYDISNILNQLNQTYESN